MSGTWGMSRPLLGLIPLHQVDFVQIQEQIMLQQIPERRMKLKGNFDDLMTGVEAKPIWEEQGLSFFVICIQNKPGV